MKTSGYGSRSDRLLAVLAATLTAAWSLGAGAQTPPVPGGPAAAGGLDYGITLDGGYASRGLALGARERGLALGHTEATIGGNIDDWFAGRATAALHSHDGEIEVELEEAFVETRALPAGLTARAGRFLSQIGYLNEQHLHADDFTDRPLAYRAFLGGHYFDTGLRLNWVAPTPFYLRLGAELLDGRMLIETPERRRGVGAFTLGAKVGGDIGRTQSWQAGLSYLRHRSDAAIEAEEADGAEADPDHAHEHGRAYSGRNLWIADAVWKWAPDGNNRNRQLRLSTEYIRIKRPNGLATGRDFHAGWYLAAVYRFAPQWEIGVRHGEIRVREPHEDQFHGGRLRETEWMVAWKRSHYSVLRLQFTAQRDRGGFPDAGNAVMLQYVMSLGGHGAHGF